MLGRLFRKKKSDLCLEAVLASDWWASKLLDPYVRYYNGSVSFALEKRSIPSAESVAVFKEKLCLAINDVFTSSMNTFPFNLSISSSDDAIVDIANSVHIDDFESHFGRGAIMYIDDAGIVVKEPGRKPTSIRK